ncbi:MAG: hypothetical protein LUO88_00820, partial [Methanoregulaceae archaeon]|nr:hypothetical protein [Methanoregulaceae archaeon]
KDGQSALSTAVQCDADQKKGVHGYVKFLPCGSACSFDSLFFLQMDLFAHRNQYLVLPVAFTLDEFVNSFLFNYGEVFLVGIAMHGDEEIQFLTLVHNPAFPTPG